LTISNKGKNYALFKKEFRFENYIKILPKCKGNKVLKFRTSHHKLPVETGRWKTRRVESQELDILLIIEKNNGKNTLVYYKYI
jgi:hypothetical protein